jgi:hypothetical protein
MQQKRVQAWLGECSNGTIGTPKFIFHSYMSTASEKTMTMREGTGNALVAEGRRDRRGSGKTTGYIGMYSY